MAAPTRVNFSEVGLQSPTIRGNCRIPAGRKARPRRGSCAQVRVDESLAFGFAGEPAAGRSQPVTAPSEALDTVIAYLWKTPLV